MTNQTPTTTIGDFYLISADDGAQLSYEVFRTRLEAQARIDRAPEEVRAEIAIREERTPATFLAIVSDRADIVKTVTDFCWFGSRIVAEGPGYVIVGAPVDYATSQALRLHSGLIGNSPYATLEDAVRAAEDLAAYLYGARA
jgi:hypothetical protein